MRTPNETPGLAHERAPARSKPSSDLSPVSASLQIVSSAANSVPLCLKYKGISELYNVLYLSPNINTRTIYSIVLLMHRGHICDPSLKGPGAYGSHMWGGHKSALTDTSTISTTYLNVYTINVLCVHIYQYVLFLGVTCAHTYFVGGSNGDKIRLTFSVWGLPSWKY